MSSDCHTAMISIVARDDDPWTAFAPHDERFDEERLSQTSSSVTASTRSSTLDVFDLHEPTIVTQPTSYRASYPGYNYRQKSEADITYATSLSASHGSVSEDEAEHDTFLHMGGWVSSQPAQGQALRRRENTKVRLSKRLPGRIKKPPIDLHQAVQGFVLAEREIESPVEASLVLKEPGTIQFACSGQFLTLPSFQMSSPSRAVQSLHHVCIVLSPCFYCVCRWADVSLY